MLTACILGASGQVGSVAAQMLNNNGIRVKMCARTSIPDAIKTIGEVTYLDVQDKKAARTYCRGTDIIIGAAGPSCALSRTMLEVANAERIPYIDPGGENLLSPKKLNHTINIPCILAAGLFPGLSGAYIKSILELNQKPCTCLDVAIGGKYRFSKAAVADFNDELIGNGQGILMGCMCNGRPSPAKSYEIEDLPEPLCVLKSFPYLTDELQHIAKQYGLKNVNGFTMVDENIMQMLQNGMKVDSVQKDRFGEECSEWAAIYIRRYDKISVYHDLLTCPSPGQITGIVIAMAALQALKSPISTGIWRFCDVFNPKSIIGDVVNQSGAKIKSWVKKNNGTCYS